MKNQITLNYQIEPLDHDKKPMPNSLQLLAHGVNCNTRSGITDSLIGDFLYQLNNTDEGLSEDFGLNSEDLFLKLKNEIPTLDIQTIFTEDEEVYIAVNITEQ